MRYPRDGSVGCPAGQGAVDAYGHVADDQIHAVFPRLEREAIAEVVEEYLALVGDERDPKALHVGLGEGRGVAPVAAARTVHHRKHHLGNFQRETLAVGDRAHDHERLHPGLKAGGEEVLEHTNRVARPGDRVVVNLERGDHHPVARDDAVAGQRPARILRIHRDDFSRARSGRRRARDGRWRYFVRVEHGHVRGDGRVAREREGDESGVRVEGAAEPLRGDVIGHLRVVPRRVIGRHHDGAGGGDAGDDFRCGVHVGVDEDELAVGVGGGDVDFVAGFRFGEDRRRARVSGGELEAARAGDGVHDPRVDVRTRGDLERRGDRSVAEASVVVDGGDSRAAHAPADVELENFRHALQHRDARRLRDDHREQTARGGSPDDVSEPSLVTVAVNQSAVAVLVVLVVAVSLRLGDVSLDRLVAPAVGREGNQRGDPVDSVGDDNHGQRIRAFLRVVRLGNHGHGREGRGPRQLHHARQVRDGEQEPLVAAGFEGHGAARARIRLARAVRGQRRDVAGDDRVGRDRVCLAGRQGARDDTFHDVRINHRSHNLRGDDAEDGSRRHDAFNARVVYTGNLDRRRGGDDDGRGSRRGADECTELEIALVEEVHLRAASVSRRLLLREYLRLRRGHDVLERETSLAISLAQGRYRFQVQSTRDWRDLREVGVHRREGRESRGRAEAPLGVRGVE